MQAHRIAFVGGILVVLFLLLPMTTLGPVTSHDQPRAGGPGASSTTTLTVAGSNPLRESSPSPLNVVSSGVGPDQGAQNLSSAYFKPGGLANGTIWSATLDGATEFGTMPRAIIFVDLVNGSYNFGIAAVNGYSVSPSIGSFTIAGKNVTRDIVFTPISVPVYTVTVVESGLKAGDAWSATVNGTTEFSTGDSVTFSLPNGTYAFGIGSVNGYNSNPTTGTLTVNGQPYTESVTFSAITFLGLAPAEGYALLAGIIAFVVVIGMALLLFLFRRWRRGSASRPPARPPPPAPPAAPPKN